MPTPVADEIASIRRACAQSPVNWGLIEVAEAALNNAARTAEQKKALLALNKAMDTIQVLDALMHVEQAFS
jgi:hypothetical protein